MQALGYDEATGTIIIGLEGSGVQVGRRRILDDVAGVLTLFGVRQVALDMSGVTEFDDGALEALLAAQRICRSQGKDFGLRNPSPSVVRALRASFADVRLLSGQL